ncbi:MAG: flavodoxin family protein, partial [Planctomycetes bacterium]|nr:flavodoxin family protein [Planctomycetota bacterium]
AVLLMTYANSDPAEAEPIRSHHGVLLRYLGWADAGMVIAPGVWPVGAIDNTQYPEQAYRLGRSL